MGVKKKDRIRCESEISNLQKPKLEQSEND